MAKNKPHWTEGLRQALATRGNRPEGEGWVTARELKAAIGKGYHFTYALIKEKLASGEWDSFAGTELDLAGRPNNQIWYRPKNFKA